MSKQDKDHYSRLTADYEAIKGHIDKDLTKINDALKRLGIKANLQITENVQTVNSPAMGTFQHKNLAISLVENIQVAESVTALACTVDGIKLGLKIAGYNI